jgi:hypothetical protein
MLSTNLPSGSNAIQNHIVIRGETGLHNNVRPEADAVYISEKGLRSGNDRMKRWPVGTCSRCLETIYNAPYLSQTEDGEFCSKECRTEKQSVPRGGRPRKFKSNADRQRHYRGQAARLMATV